MTLASLGRLKRRPGWGCISKARKSEDMMQASLASKNMQTYAYFVNFNENLFSPDQIKRVQEITQGIRILILVLD
jgi:hypothetical protein